MDLESHLCHHKSLLLNVILSEFINNLNYCDMTPVSRNCAVKKKIQQRHLLLDNG
jgi:hypothetical protein